jgi:hypothetical protein
MKTSVKTLEKRAIEDYLSTCSNGVVDIETMVKWLQKRSNGLFHYVRGEARELSFREQLKRKF